MNAGTLLELVADVINLLKTQGLIDPTGNFVEPSVVQIPALVSGLEAILKAKGVVVPEKLEKALQLVPLVLAIAK